MRLQQSQLTETFLNLSTSQDSYMTCYIMANSHAVPLWDWNCQRQRESGKQIIFSIPCCSRIWQLESMLRSHSNPSPLTRTRTYIQKRTHFPPTCIQIPPQYTGPLWSHKQKQQAAKKTPRGLSIHCSINLTAVREGSRTLTLTCT